MHRISVSCNSFSRAIRALYGSMWSPKLTPESIDGSLFEIKSLFHISTKLRIALLFLICLENKREKSLLVAAKLSAWSPGHTTATTLFSKQNPLQNRLLSPDIPQ